MIASNASFLPTQPHTLSARSSSDHFRRISIARTPLLLVPHPASKHDCSNQAISLLEDSLVGSIVSSTISQLVLETSLPSGLCPSSDVLERYPNRSRIREGSAHLFSASSSTTVGLSASSDSVCKFTFPLAFVSTASFLWLVLFFPM